MTYSQHDGEETTQDRSASDQAGAREDTGQTGLLHRTAGTLAALGNRVKDWYSSHSSQGYLPNLHIDE